MNWLQREKEGGSGDGNSGIEIKPEMINKALEPKLNELKTGFSTELDTKLKPISDFIAAQQAKETEIERKRQETQRKEQQQNLEISPEDFLTDPEGAIDKKLSPLVQTIQVQSAIIMRDKTLKEMDYYSTDPTFRSKVDSLIDSQPLGLRSNANVIMNAYKTVHYDMQDEIKEGKIKSKASMTSLSNNGTGGHTGGSGTDQNTDTLSADEKRYARKMGLTDEQWIQGRRELEYV